MAERTLYDLLEVSESASSETIQAAYDRLAVKFDPARDGNAGNAAVRMQFDAIRQAFLTLGNADGRAQYDRKLELRNLASQPQVEVLEPFWTVPKMIIAAVLVVSIGGFYHVKQKKEEARLEAERVIAVAKAKEAEEKAKAEAEQRQAQQIESERERAERVEANRLRRERDADLRQVQRDIRTNEITNRVFSTVDRAQVRNDDYQKRADEMRVKNEEAQAAAAARNQLARDRAELCRIERERYGKTISC